MQKRWIIENHDANLVSTISQSHQLSSILSTILVSRKITDFDHIQKYLKPSLTDLPDPFLMKGMNRAVERLVEAIRNKEKITIYGDYDVDGTTSTALLMDFFNNTDAVADYYIPHRLREGYSLNGAALQRLRSQGTRVVITVDNGISAWNEAKIAKELGIDLIITDHHEVPEPLPSAYAVINPKQKGDEFPGKELAGVGVAFYLTIALRMALREAGLFHQVPNLRQSLDLVAVGTVADMAPLVGINRILVREGIKVLRSTSRIGLRTLREAAGVEGEIGTEHIAFRLGPRLNAVGRLDDAALGVRLLLADQQEEAVALARKMNSANEERQSIEDQLVEEAVAMIVREGLDQRRRSLIVYHPEWHPGVVGIAASRLVEKFYLPSIVLTRDGENLKGSARSIRGLHLVETLRKCGDLLLKFGGHQYAAGLSLIETNFSALVERFDQEVNAQLSEEDFLPSLKVDVESGLEGIDPPLLEQLQWLEPFGLGNPQPVLLTRHVKVKESRVVGEKHLKLKLGEGRAWFGAIGFRMAEKIPPPNSYIDLAFVPEWNEWNGNKSIQLKLLDLQHSPSDASRK